MQFDSRVWFVSAGAAILCYQLILPPVVGLADNGDFGKVIGRFDLYAHVHRTYEFVDTIYEFRPDKHWESDFVSLEIALVPPAIWLNSLISKDGRFDLRCIGIIHGALFLAALWLFAPLLAGQRRWLRWLIYSLVLLVFCDVMYANSLNAFYMDEPAYLFLLLAVVAWLRTMRWKRKRDAILLIVCSLLMISAKAQHALVGIWIALLFLAAGHTLPALRRHWWYAAGAALLAASAWMMTKAQPSDYTSYPLYNVTFETILPHAKNVGRTLADLGLDDSYRRYIGMKAYLPDSGMEDPEFRRRFMQRLSLGKLAWYYLRHAAVAYRTLKGSLAEAGRQRAFGNFDISTGYPASAESRAFSLWSGMKRQLFERHGARFLWAFVSLSALFGALLALARRSLPKGAGLAGVAMVGAAVCELATATLCDSMDITRHAMIFFVFFDLLVLASVWLALHLMVNWEFTKPRSSSLS